MSKPNLEFGTDILQDSVAKLTKIYLRVKGKSLHEEQYRYISLYCQLSDITKIDFFTKMEGSKRLAVTSLLCAGFSKASLRITDFPVSVFDIGQVFGRLMDIDEVDWVIDDTVMLKMFRVDKMSCKRITITIPEELWGIIYRVSMDLGIQFTSFLLYLLRTGIAEYNTFVERFSRGTVEVPYEYLRTAEKSERLLMSALDIRYGDLLNRIRHLYKTYSKVLDNGHEDLKKEIEKIIEKSI